ncbi:phthiocerol/phthiodiolone dimycocerosyl transferase family protein [Streptomyces sp. WM6378]|uniref:phthiocerol/phthiodiolone dimycocerosyl transferase family protein n=1 Tax=Streptomyces sp. WM6378 TaxID=1415557 RepID=UPI000D149D4C
MLTNWGRIPDLRTPARLTIEDFRGAILSQRLSAAPFSANASGRLRGRLPANLLPPPPPTSSPPSTDGSAPNWPPHTALHAPTTSSPPSTRPSTR